MPIPSFTAGASLPIPDGSLTGNNTVSVSDVAGGRTFFPKGISISSSNDSEENVAGYATIRCILVGENDSAVATRRCNLGQSPIAVKKVWANGTTARGIEFLAE